MRIGKPTGEGQDLRMTTMEGGGLLVIEMTWAEWDELVKDAEHLRETGEMRNV